MSPSCKHANMYWLTLNTKQSWGGCLAGLANFKFWPYDGVTRKVRALSTLAGFILWAPWMSVPNFRAINPIVNDWPIHHHCQHWSHTALQTDKPHKLLFSAFVWLPDNIYKILCLLHIGQMVKLQKWIAAMNERFTYLFTRSHQHAVLNDRSMKNVFSLIHFFIKWWIVFINS